MNCSLGLAPLIVKSIYEQLRVVGETLGTSMLIVEQNAKLALELRKHCLHFEQWTHCAFWLSPKNCQQWCHQGIVFRCQA
jgi:environmental stress-induced protein Ves